MKLVCFPSLKFFNRKRQESEARGRQRGGAGNRRDAATPRGRPGTLLLPVLSDLYSAPDSCHGRCWEAFDKHHPCHCNARCREFGNCCEDFESLCGHGQSPAPFRIAPETEGPSLRVVPGPAASAASGTLLEMETRSSGCGSVV